MDKGSGYKSFGNRKVLAVVAALLLLSAAVVLFMLKSHLPEETHPDDPMEAATEVTEAATEAATEEPTEAPTEAPTEPKELTVEATASITCTGDILMHEAVIAAGLQEDGSYNFDSIFKYVTDYTAGADYMVGNLETTLCGSDNGYRYAGFPKFNCPDAIVEAAKKAGFDMLLTANNHCYDTGVTGVIRTVKTIAEYGLDSLGTYETAEDTKYRVVDINGIRVGMACYTYASVGKNGLESINGIPTVAEVSGLINAFDPGDIDGTCEELSRQVAAMREDGAECIVMYMHWGQEYSRKVNSSQKALAQAMCDMGVDVIIGGHPHVIQPMELLTSTVDESHKTVCIYSVGNAVSNQRMGYVAKCTTAHTEDGVLATVTFVRYSDGTVALDSTELVPCWVNYCKTDSGREFNILPLQLEAKDQWQTLYGLTDKTVQAAQASYDRTMELMGEGLEVCRSYLGQAREQRKEDYLAAQTVK